MTLDFKPFFDSCLTGFARVTHENTGYWHLGNQTRLLAYAKLGYIDVTGNVKLWTRPIEHEMFHLIGRELCSEDWFLEHTDAVNAFASYVYGALEARRQLGEIKDHELLVAHIAIPVYDVENMNKIGELFHRAQRSDWDGGIVSD